MSTGGRSTMRTWRVLPAALTGVAGLTLALLAPAAVPDADAANYLLLAGRWAAGDWDRAVNGYWSPLVPLLLAPVAAAGWLSPRALMVLGALVSALAIAALARLMRVLGVDAASAAAVSAAAACVTLGAALGNGVPDLLMATLLLAFLADVLERPSLAARASLWAALAFLAKAFALPLVVTYLCALIAMRRLRRAPRPALVAPLVTLLLGIALMLVWIVPISLDAGYPTPSTASRYNRALAAPGSRGLPYTWAGLIEPTRPGAFWAWEDPSTLPRAQDLFPAEVPVDPRHPAVSALDDLTERIGRNLRSSVTVAALVAPLVLLAAAGLLRELGRAARRRDADWRSLETGLAVAVHVGGLLTLFVRLRYLHLPLLLAAALAGKTLSRPGRASATRSLALVGLAALSAIAPLRLMAERYERATALATFARTLQRSADLEGRRLASIPASLSGAGSVCLQAGCVYLGEPRARGGTSLEKELAHAAVDLLLIAPSSGAHAPPNATFVTDLKGHGKSTPHWRLYRLPSSLYRRSSSLRTDRMIVRALPEHR